MSESAEILITLEKTKELEEYQAWKTRKQQKEAEAMERAKRASSTWASRVRETYKKACEFDLTPVLADVEDKIESAAESRQTGIVINPRLLPGAATIEDLCKAMQEKHPDMKFSVLHKPEQQISFLMFDPKE